MGPSIDNHFPTANSNLPDSCDKADTPHIDAKIHNNTMSSALDTRSSFPSSSTANLPLTQITNNGGTININYNIDTASVPRLDKGKAFAVDKGEGIVHAEHDPDLASPLRPDAESFKGEPASAKSTCEGHAAPQDIVAKHTENPPYKKSDEAWGISDDEKAKVRDSIDLILFGPISRKELSEALMNLAEALVLIYDDDDDDDEIQCTQDDPKELGTDPASAEPYKTWSTGLMCPNPVSEIMYKIDNTIEECGSLKVPVKSTPISPTDESFRDDCSVLRINAPPTCQGFSSSQHGLDAVGGQKSATTSIETLVLSKNNFPPLPSSSAQDNAGVTVEAETQETSSKQHGKVTDMTSSDSARSSALSSQEADTGPESKDVPASTVITPAASPKKYKKKSRRAPAHRSGQSEGGSIDVDKEETVSVRQDDSVLEHRFHDLSGRPQGSSLKGADEYANQDEDSCKLDLKNGGLVTGGLVSQSTVAVPGPSSSRSPAKLFPAKTEAPNGGSSPSPNNNNNNELGKKMEKRRSTKKYAAVEAGQCEGHHHTTDGRAGSSASGPAARRAMVVDMLSRMAGVGPNSGAGSGATAQGSSSSSSSGGGYRDFTFLLPPPAESRKCRLCRNMFTDKSNVKQTDGGAPCSFHPGVLEDKTGKNTIYAFSCCGGPPIMAGPNLVAMNLVSPGCIKCYHQDKRSAWNTETFTMKDPVLFEE